ncbi:MAG: helix-turn-helix domain-containing protein [Solirubrobacteraceae bacterium]
MSDPLAAAILQALAADPEAVAALRELVERPPPEPVSPPPAYTVSSLAGCLGVSQRVVRNAIGRHELAAVKRGGRWLIPYPAVQTWLAPIPSVRPRAALTGPLTEAMTRLSHPPRHRR